MKAMKKSVSNWESKGKKLLEKVKKYKIKMEF